MPKLKVGLLSKLYTKSYGKFYLQTYTVNSIHEFKPCDEFNT
jgi:hypothetical protein